MFKVQQDLITEVCKIHDIETEPFNEELFKANKNTGKSVF
jgi:hypothetical protein